MRVHNEDEPEQAVDVLHSANARRPDLALRYRTPVCAIRRFPFYKHGHRKLMTNAPRPSAQTFAQFMASLPREEIDRVNELNRKEALEQHEAFSEAFKAGSCSFCGGTLTSFDATKPCRHWLLNPDGVRKEHVERLASQLSWSVLENHVRWVANEEAGKLLELTIKYKNLEWSFSCGATDLAGHEGGGEHSQVPHWHFQMYVDGKPFVRYNDFHLPLSEADAGFLEFMRAHPR